MCRAGLFRDGDSGQLLLDASQQLRIWFGLDLLGTVSNEAWLAMSSRLEMAVNLRIPNAVLATLVSTSTALLVTVSEELVARFAGPPDAASGFPEDTLLPLDWRLSITRIAIGILFQLGPAEHPSVVIKQSTDQV